MILYHGTTEDRANSLVAAGTYVLGESNAWSSEGGEAGLFCSNVYEYAEQYGSVVVEINVNDSSVLTVQECPIGPGDYGWRDEFAGAIEYLIPEGVPFSAKII